VVYNFVVHSFDMGRDEKFNSGDEIVYVLKASFETPNFRDIGNRGAIMKFLENVDDFL
jgi:hypothetical protein